MRRPATIATLVLALALAPAWAQHGAGHGGFAGGGHAGFSGGGHGGFAAHGGGFGGHMGGAHAFSGSGSHSFGGRRSFSGMHSGRGYAGRGLNYRSSHRLSFRGDRFAANRFDRNRFRGDHFHGNRFHDGRFRSFGLHNCFGLNCGLGWGWPWWYGGYYDPWLDSWWWESHSSYDEDRAREIEAANEMNQQSLEQQRMLREEDQDAYARQDPEAPQARGPEVSAAPTPATVLVFRDQHKQEVQNYAIVGQTLWAFGVSRTQKISLADLDLAATSTANEDRGVDFRVPGTGEGQ